MSNAHPVNNPNLPPARRRFFVIVTIAIPLAALAVLELCLRVFGYGPDLSLFHTEVVDGSTYYVMNPTVGVRYFSRSQFVPASSTQYFTMPKPAGTFRIFCLGGRSCSFRAEHRLCGPIESRKDGNSDYGAVDTRPVSHQFR